MGDKRFNLTRQPWMFTQTFHDENRNVYPNGSQDWWMDFERSSEVLVQQAKLAASVGCKRLMMNRPAGTNGISHVPGANWLPLAEHQRDAIIEASGYAEIVPFSGSAITDNPRSLRGWTQRDQDDFSWLFDPSKNAANWIENTAGWIGAGTSTFVLDAAALPDRLKHYTRAAKALRKSGITLIGEALPKNNWYLRSMPYMAALHNLMQPTRRNKRVNPKTTRCFVWWIGTSKEWVNATTFDEQRTLMLDFIGRGFIPVLPATEQGAELYQIAMRAYEDSQ